jgi:cytochrome oxidase Cu insertion factor (SCO1/SenC/PrrC family)
MNLKNSKKVFLLLFILIFPSAFYVYLTAGKERSFVRLPYYGPKHPFVITEDGKTKKDTVFYSVTDFIFKNQNGGNISSGLLRGRIWVCCFEHLKDSKYSPSQAILMDRIESRTDLDTTLRLITFALDSESTKSLADYANMVHAGKRQFFLSADSGQMNVFASTKFYQPADTSSKNGFIHFFLVDREGCIRGIYNGLHVKEIDALIDNISMLEAAYYVKENREKSKKGGDDDGGI